ncbi:MAG: hypothetical protein ACKV2V_28970 [Blastocatellia bacterium]
MIKKSKFGGNTQRPGNRSGGNGGGGGGSKRPPQKRRPAPGHMGGPSARSNDIENTGMEAAYLRELVEGEIPVVVVMRTGEELRGTVRYYDRDVFSLGRDEGPKLFLRKCSIRYMYEVEE